MSISLENLTATEAEALAYSEGFPGTARQFARIADLQRALTDLRASQRAECREMDRPCPFVSCKWHLYLDVSESGLAIKINHPNIDPTEMKHTCTLAVANVGGVTLYEVGKIINITRERVRQIEAFALAQLTSTAIKDHE